MGAVPPTTKMEEKKKRVAVVPSTPVRLWSAPPAVPWTSSPGILQMKEQSLSEAQPPKSARVQLPDGAAPGSSVRRPSRPPGALMGKRAGSAGGTKVPSPAGTVRGALVPRPPSDGTAAVPLSHPDPESSNPISSRFCSPCGVPSSPTIAASCPCRASLSRLALCSVSLRVLLLFYPLFVLLVTFSSSSSPGVSQMALASTAALLLPSASLRSLRLATISPGP
ncbi:unnamed protein product [Lampetra fluviatilis]